MSHLPILTTEADEEIARLRLALKIAGQAFRMYEELHRRKNPPDLEKAARNKAYANMCEKALAAGENQQDNRDFTGVPT